MRTVARAAGIFAKGGREQDSVYALRQAMPVGEVAGKFIVGATAQHKLNLVVRRQGLEIFGVEGVGLSRIWTLHVHDLDDFGGNPLQWPLSAGFEEHSIFSFQKLAHQRQQFPLLEHGFAAGDFHQPAVGTKLLHFVPHLLGSHFPSALKRVLTVAPRAAEIAAGEADEDAR